MTWTNDDTKIFREMINQETSLLNKRLSLLITINGLLLTALSLVSKNNLDLKPILCSVGILISLILLITIIFADRAIRKLIKKWKNNIDKNITYVPIIGLETNGFIACILWGIIPLAFICIWCFILQK